MGRTTLTGAMITFVAALFGCASAGEGESSEEVDVVMNELELFNVANDPVAPGSPVTVCTVGGITMHCCPNWQAGRNHYVMTGVNLATNTFRCGRLVPSLLHSQQITLAPATQTWLTDGVTFRPSCPNGQAMVGLHWDLKRVACTPVDGGDFALVTYTSFFRMSDGMRHCGPPFGDSTSAASFMWGMSSTRPDTLLCKH